MKSKEFKIEKNHVVYLILIAILILGLYLRIYHLDFPSIGYHNMKENEYISEAIFFNEQGNYLHRRTFNFWGLEDGPGYFEEYAQMPIVPYLTAFSWKIIGSEPIWIPRMLILISMLGASGTSILRNVYMINRGYEEIAERLNSIGADIKIIKGN